MCFLQNRQRSFFLFINGRLVQCSPLKYAVDTLFGDRDLVCPFTLVSLLVGLTIRNFLQLQGSNYLHIRSHCTANRYFRTLKNAFIHWQLLEYPPETFSHMHACRSLTRCSSSRILWLFREKRCSLILAYEHYTFTIFHSSHDITTESLSPFQERFCVE